MATQSVRTSRTEVPAADQRENLVEPEATAVTASKPPWSRRRVLGVLVALVALAVFLLALLNLLNSVVDPSSTGSSPLPSAPGAPSAPGPGSASAPTSLAPSASVSVSAAASLPVVVGEPDVSAAAALPAANTNPGTRLRVPPNLLGPLPAALPGRALVTDAAASAEAPDLVVSRGAAPADVPTTPVARFGALRVGQIMPTTRAATDELAARRSAGSQLLSNGALRVTDQARTILRAGEVDPRLMLVLVGLLIDHDISVDVVAPDSSSDPASARRSLKVVDVDGASALDIVTTFVDSQSRALLPRSLDTADNGSSVVLHYPVPSPIGLLGGASTAAAPASRTTSASPDAAHTDSMPSDPSSDLASVPAIVRPMRLRIPGIGVDSSLEWLRVGAAGRLRPPIDPDLAGWFPGGAVPGDLGAAVIAGHCDSVTGKAVFWRLTDLQAGSRMWVTNSDGTRVQFEVADVRRVSRASFPTEDVYGPTPDRTLRLITCGGVYDHVHGRYLDNVLVLALAV